jgi:hypothetical protein
MKALVAMTVVAIALINAPLTMSSAPAAGISETEPAEPAIAAAPPWVDCGINLECLR